MYFAEEKVGNVFAIFAVLAIFTACLGLFSLSAFSAEEKTKEIGVRKVLGSSVSQIVLLLSKEFIKFILIAFIIATPIAYLTIKSWLQDFAYRIDIGPSVFFISGLIVLLVALVTVSFQAIKAATANPVEALKYE
jgi:putative ABC transport system permease protein